MACVVLGAGGGGGGYVPCPGLGWGREGMPLSWSCPGETQFNANTTFRLKRTEKN